MSGWVGVSGALGPGARLDPDQRAVLGALLALQRQSWEQGVTGHALLDLGLDDLARVVARDSVTRQAADGRLAEIDAAGLVNGAAAAEAVRWLASRSGDPSLGAAHERQLRWLLQGCPRADDGTLFHLEGGRQVWVDSVYMVVPELVATGHLDAARTQLAGHRRRLFDADAGLWTARWDEDAGARVLDVRWATGNGWVVAGLARALRGLDAAAPGAAGLRAEAAEHVRVVVDACLAHRRSDGTFHDVLDDPASFTDVTVAEMLAYGVLTGVADGWLPQRYAEAGRSLVATAREHVDADGFVTGVCGAPRFDRQGTSAEAQAFFLLATAAEQRLDAA